MAIIFCIGIVGAPTKDAIVMPDSFATEFHVGQTIKTIHGLHATIVDVLPTSGRYDIKYKNSRHGYDYNVSQDFFKVLELPNPVKRNVVVPSYEYVAVALQKDVQVDVGSISSINIVSGKRKSLYRG